MFACAYLEETGNGKLRHEEQLLSGEFERRGIPVKLYTAKRILRRQLPLSNETFIAGDMDAMHGAMCQLGIEPPAANDYPKSLFPFLFRNVWKSTLAEVEFSINADGGPARFAKPAVRCKSFTGRVFSCRDDFYGLGSTSRREEVWCSEVVGWISEYRVYVLGTQILSIDHYAGDENVRLNPTALEAAIHAYHDSGEAPSAYGIDFGVLSSGETALIEANDGYALGAYQISPAPYADLLLRRWSELLDSLRA